MKIPSNNLISLLRLLDGRMAAPDADLLRASLKSDPALKHRWRLLEKACQETDPQAQSAVLSLVEPETLAAFVEGALPADEAAEIEAACWQSTTLLREIRSALRRASAGARWACHGGRALRSPRPTPAPRQGSPAAARELPAG